MTTELAPEASLHKPEDVLALLREQDVLYRRLDACAARQRDLISLEDTRPLLTLLAERQKLAADLTSISARFEPVRRDWDHHRAHLSPPQRDEADRLLQSIKTRLRVVIERDEEDARLLSARKQAAGQALRSSHSTGQALNAYRTQTYTADRPERLDEAS